MFRRAEEEAWRQLRSRGLSRPAVTRCGRPALSVVCPSIRTETPQSEANIRHLPRSSPGGAGRSSDTTGNSRTRIVYATTPHTPAWRVQRQFNCCPSGRERSHYSAGDARAGWRLAWCSAGWLVRSWRQWGGAGRGDSRQVAPPFTMRSTLAPRRSRPWSGGGSSRPTKSAGGGEVPGPPRARGGLGTRRLAWSRAGAFAVHGAAHGSAPVTRVEPDAIAFAAAFGVQGTAHASAATTGVDPRSRGHGEPAGRRFP
jgi:hypothetical protein